MVTRPGMVNPKLNAHAVFRATEHAPILAAPYNQFKVRAFSRFYARARIFGDAFTWGLCFDKVLTSLPSHSAWVVNSGEAEWIFDCSLMGAEKMANLKIRVLPCAAIKSSGGYISASRTEW